MPGEIAAALDGPKVRWVERSGTPWLRANAALINIRPAQGNRSMLIADEAIRSRVREITFALIGRGEPLT